MGTYLLISPFFEMFDTFCFFLSFFLFKIFLIFSFPFIYRLAFIIVFFVFWLVVSFYRFKLLFCFLFSICFKLLFKFLSTDFILKSSFWIVVFFYHKNDFFNCQVCRFTSIKNFCILQHFLYFIEKYSFVLSSIKQIIFFLRKILENFLKLTFIFFKNFI